MLSGMYDLEPLRLCYINAQIRLDAGQAARLSPVRLRAVVGGPMIIAVGDEETAEFHRQASEFAAWQGVKAELVVVPSANHYTVVRQLAARGSPLLARFQAALSA
jgi:arylformamidase